MSAPAPPLITSPAALQRLCEQLRAANAPIAFDTEFLTERRYAPKLCLVQLYAESASGHIEALVDPLATSMEPLLPLLSDESVIKLVHSGGQDLSIFVTLGATPRGIFDTQIAAAFLGYGHQIGYADLVKRITGEQLSKAQQFTDWAARPLSPEQRLYALDDVRYLPPLYAKLQSDLAARGRTSWAQAEFSRLEERASRPLDEVDLLRKFNLSGLSRRQLANLREIATWREATARRIDKPPTFIVPDATLLQIAKHPPADIEALKNTRGLPGMSASQLGELLRALQTAAALPPDLLPERTAFERPDPRAESVANLLSTLAALRADEEQISRSYLAPRDQLAQLANWWVSARSDEPEPPPLPILSDWRRELLGEQLLLFLSGELALSVNTAARDDLSAPAVRTVPHTK